MPSSVSDRLIFLTERPDRLGIIVDG